MAHPIDGNLLFRTQAAGQHELYCHEIAGLRSEVEDPKSRMGFID
jgi:hypothetical protein